MTSLLTLGCLGQSDEAFLNICLLRHGLPFAMKNHLLCYFDLIYKEATEGHKNKRSWFLASPCVSWQGIWNGYKANTHLPVIRLVYLAGEGGRICARLCKWLTLTVPPLYSKFHPVLTAVVVAFHKHKSFLLANPPPHYSVLFCLFIVLRCSITAAILKPSG